MNNYKCDIFIESEVIIMKRKMKQMMACLLTFVMIISLLQISVPFVKAAEENRVSFGNPVEVQAGEFQFPNLTVTGDGIKSITIQFSSAIKNGDEILVDESKLGGKIERFNKSGEACVVLNAKDASASVSANEWAAAIKDAVTVRVVDSYDARKISARISDSIQSNVVIYNYLNGHYYEVVHEKKSWTEAFETARTKKYRGSTGYLVNITTKQENDFVYSICGVTTWIGTTCASDISIGDNILDDAGNTSDQYGNRFQSDTKGKTLNELYGYEGKLANYPHYWFYLDGDESGKLMCYNSATGTDKVTMAEQGTDVALSTAVSNGGTVSGAMEERNYNNWANSVSWKQSNNYDGVDPTITLNEPNENGTEFYMCMYGKSEVLQRDWQIPAMWNDFANTDGNVNSYVIEYGKKSEPFEEEIISTVTINSDNLIKANNFIVSVKNAQDAQADDVKSYANTSATDTASNDVTAQVQVDSADLQRLNDVTEPGIVSGITLKHPDGTTTLDVTATVVDKTDTNPGKKITIGANNITITVDDVKNLTKDKVKELTGVVATVNGFPVSVEDIVLYDSSYNGILPMEGVYPVTFEYGGYNGAHVTVNVNVVGAQEEYPKLDVHDFIVSVDDAKAADGADIIKYTDATPYFDEEQEDTLDRVSVPSSEVNKLTSVDGPAIVPGIELSYNPSIPAGASTKKEPVTAYVVEKTNDNANKDGFPTIGANDFTISVEQARRYLEADTTVDIKESTDLFKKISGVVASTIKGTIVPGQNAAITIANTTLEAEKGVYDMTFEYNHERVTVKVTVVDDGTDNGPKVDKGNVAAADFTHEYDARKPDSEKQLSQEQSKELASADATTALGIPVDAVPDANQLKKINDAIGEGKTGKYPLTFTNAEEPDVSVTITVTLKLVDPRIIADDIIVPTDKVPVYDDDIKDEADVDVTTPDGGKKGPDKVDVKDKGDLPTLADKKEPGVTKVTFDDPDPSGAPDKTVTATVVDKTTGPQLTEDGKESITIGANHYSITIAQAEAWINSGKKATDMATVFKALANASATEKPVDGSDGANLVDKDYINIKNDSIVAENGIYKMTFEYKGAEVTVNVTVKDDGITDTTGTPVQPNVIPAVNLTGNDFCVPAKSTPLDETSFKDKGDVTAQKTDGSKIPADDITVDSADLAKVNDAITKGEKGDYPVKVTTNGVQTIVTVTVTDVAEDKPYQSSDGTPMKDTIAANNFTIGIEDYDKINNNVTNVVKLSNAQAYDVDTKASVKITSVDTSKVENKPGTYPVTLTTEHGTSTTITVTINDDWKTIGDVDKASDANKTTDTTKNPTAVPNSKKPDDKKPDDTIGVDKVYEISNPKDVTQDLDNGRTVDKVNLDGKDIPASQYTVKDNVLTIKSSALSGKKPGTYPVVITYKDGSKKTFNIKVVEYDAQKVITKVPILKMKKNIGVGNKFTLNLVGIDKTAVKQFKSSNKKVATISSKGVITGKKKGKCVITANVIQKGSYYKVRVNLTVKKPMMIYNLKNAALSKKSGELPEFNVYKRIFKGKKTKLKFTSVQKNAKITYTTKNKKIATVTKKGVIKGKKRGFTVVTAKIVQNGKTYVTRIFVRVDDNKTNKQNKKYLKENYGKKKK